MDSSRRSSTKSGGVPYSVCRRFIDTTAPAAYVQVIDFSDPKSRPGLFVNTHQGETMPIVTRARLRTFRASPSTLLPLIILLALTAFDQPRLASAQSKADILR